MLVIPPSLSVIKLASQKAQPTPYVTITTHAAAVHYLMGAALRQFVLFHPFTATSTYSTVPVDLVYIVEVVLEVYAVGGHCLDNQLSVVMRAGYQE